MVHFDANVQSTLSFTRRVLLRSATLAGIAVVTGAGEQGIGRAFASSPATPRAQALFPLADRLDWFLAAVNSGGTSLTEADIVDNVAPELLALMPPAQVIGLIQSLSAGYGNLTLQGTTRPPTSSQTVALISAAVGLQLALPITIEISPPHRITALKIYPSLAGDGNPLRPEFDEIRSAPPVSLFDIGGRALYGDEAGSGGPTVVFEAGLTDSAATWSGIIPAIAATTRVFSYDRANTWAGASNPAAMPRTASDAVDDLQGLLRAADVPGPYVLVGHSVGGIISRLFASRYPDEVAGLVLVDASHEEQDIRRQALVSPELFAAEQQFLQTANTEGIDLTASFTQMREARAATVMPNIPLVVLSAGLNDPSSYPAGWPMEIEATLHGELQSDLASLVPNSHHVIAGQSGHYIQQSQPDLVVSAILDVVRAINDPTTWATSET